MTELVTESEIPEQEVAQELDKSVHVDDESQKPIYNTHQMTDAVKRERKKAFERGKQEALMELQAQQQAQQQQAQAAPPVPAQQPQAQPGSLGGMQQLSQDEVLKMIEQHAPRALQQQAQKLQEQNLVNSFVSKMQAAESKYPGLETKLGELDYSTIHPIIKMANDMENTGDIMNELLENPMKMGNLVSLVYSQPALAQKAMLSLSSSIKTNSDAAAKEKSESEPFGQIKPSNNYGKDDGEMTTDDFQKMFRKNRGK